MPTTIQQFFQYYLDAFRRRDADTMADCYAIPCVFAALGRQVVFDDRETLRHHFEEIHGRYRKAGLNAERFVIRSLMMLGDDFAVANVAWTMLGANSRVKTYHTAYNVYRTDAGWSIWAVTLHEEFRDPGNA